MVSISSILKNLSHCPFLKSDMNDFRVKEKALRDYNLQEEKVLVTPQLQNKGIRLHL